MKKIHFKSKIRIALLLAFVLGLVSTSLAGWQSVFAGTLTKSTVMEYNMATSGQGNIAIAFRTVGSGATSVSVNLNGNGSNGLTGGGATVSSTGLAVTGTGCSTLFPAFAGVTASAPSYSSPTVSFTVSSLSATTNYCAIITSTAGLITNSATPGVYSVTITAGSDSQIDGVDVIASDTYTVTGTIASTFTMSFPGSDTFTGNLSSSAVTSTSGITVTINTNAASGWFIWAADTNAGLYSTQQLTTIPAVSTSSNVNMAAVEGAAHYALGVTSVTSGAATTDYNDTGSSGAGLTTAATGFNEIASGTVPYANDYVVVKELADIAATTPPATDYSDTVTLVGAGSF